MIDMMFNEVRRAGFRTMRSEVINEQVLSALRMDSDRRIQLVKKHLPGILRGVAHEFAGTTGTRLYRSFLRGTRSYVCLALAK